MPPNVPCAPSPWAEKLPVRGLRRWRRARRRDLRPDRHRQANGLDPEFYLCSVLSRIADHPINRIEQLLRLETS